MSRTSVRRCLAVAAALLSLSHVVLGASPERRVRSTSTTSVTRDVKVQRDVDVNRNVNVHHDVDVDVDVYHHGCCYRPVAPAAAAATAVVVTAAVVGSVAYALPPSCTSIVVNGFAYHQCGTAWYQPRFAGTTVTYVVVNPPR